MDFQRFTGFQQQTSRLQMLCQNSHIVGYKPSPGNCTAANLSEKRLIHLMAEDSIRHYTHPKITTLLIRALLAVVSFHFESQFTCHQLIKKGTVMSSFIRVTHLTELGNSVHAFLHQVIKPSYIIPFQKFS